MTISDFDLREAVLEKLHTYTELRESRITIDVSVEDGVVTLRGNVFSETQQRKTLFFAATVPGVQKVIDDLFDDENLKLAVAQAVSAAGLDTDLSRPIVTSSYLGNVTLVGMVNSEDQSDQIISTVRRVPGVRNVAAKLSLPESA